MSSVVLVHPEEQCEVLALHVVNKCTLFRNDVALAAVPDKIRSSVPLSVFLQFVLALTGNPVTVTDANLPGLFLLCEEFDFETLGAQLFEFKQLTRQNQIEGAETRARIVTLKEQIQRRDHDSEMLKRAGEKIAALEGQIQQRDHDVEVLQKALARVTAIVEDNPLDSFIIPDFPEIFSVFQGKHFRILWRGSRDGFKAQEFHDRCDGYANTLTVILDTNGNIFGGFTPLEWQSPMFGCALPDDSMKTFLFTLKNPHNFPGRIFRLNATVSCCVIGGNSTHGLWFIGAIFVDVNCDTHSKNFASLGGLDTNGTGLDERTIFTGSLGFQVNEIEVFEITD
jgi:hypothetical protein